EAGQDLRHLRAMTELVREIADGSDAAESGREPMADLQIANQRLAADEKLVGQHTPRPNGETVRPDALPQQRATLGTNLEIGLEADGLSIEVEMAERRVGGDERQETLHQPHEANPKFLERLVPFAIPVRVRHDHEVYRSSRRRRRQRLCQAAHWC